MTDELPRPDFSFVTEPPPIAFVDIETISLRPDWRHVWEVAVHRPVPFVRNNRPGGGPLWAWRRASWFLPVDLDDADPVALRVGRYHDRHPHGLNWRHDPTRAPLDEMVYEYREAAEHVAKLLQGSVHLVGAVVSFDEERLRGLLRANGQCPDWHYHLVDVEALAAGYLRRSAVQPGGMVLRGIHELASPPWDSNALSVGLGVDPGRYDRHTADGDCRWAQAMWEAMYGPVIPDHLVAGGAR